MYFCISEPLAGSISFSLHMRKAPIFCHEIPTIRLTLTPVRQCSCIAYSKQQPSVLHGCCKKCRLGQKQFFYFTISYVLIPSPTPIRPFVTNFVINIPLVLSKDCIETQYTTFCLGFRITIYRPLVCFPTLE